MDMPEHPLDSELRHLGTDASVEEKLETIWSAYEAATARCLDRPPSDAQRQEVLSWLRIWDDICGSANFWTKRPLLTPLLHATVAEKASRLVQLGCRGCVPDLSVAGAGAINFPVGVSPWSSQSRRNRVVIRKAVHAALVAKGTALMPWRESPICISIVALVPRASRPKDVDNLVKGLLDALQGYLYPDDRFVQCLTVRRLEYAGDQGHYLVHAVPVVAPDYDVVYDDPRPPRLLTGLVPGGSVPRLDPHASLAPTAARHSHSCRQQNAIISGALVR